MTVKMNRAHILWMKDIGMEDVAQVGGKNASLGELIRSVVPKGVRVPQGFCVTAEAYYYFLKETGLDTFIATTLDGLNTRNFKELARCGKLVRDAIRKTPLPTRLERAIIDAYVKMEKEYGKNTDVAVRSSATAEDLPGASFAGEHETYLGIRGAENVATAVVWAMASLFTDRAISYRADKGFAHTKVALSVGVQKMVRSDTCLPAGRPGASGVMFTVDTESGFRDLVLINATWGLGELIVQGRVTPDEYLVLKSSIGKVQSPIIGKTLGVKNKKMQYAHGRKGVIQTKTVKTTVAEQSGFVLNEKEIVELARWGALIEKHYSERAKVWTPMDMEWARDGQTGELYIVQARPETIQARRDFSKFVEYKVSGQGKELVRGISVGSSAAVGATRIIMSPREIKQFKKGEILVTEMTDPDWEPIMKMASAIIPDRGGRTSHAAIVSRELGLPAIVGTGNATKVLKTGTLVTVDTTGSAGIITARKAKITVREHSIGALPETKTKIMVNIASPDIAFEQSFLPVKGVGLAREEFIIASNIGIHPLAILNIKKVPAKVRSAITKKIIGWKSPVDYYVDNLAYGIAKIGAAFSPRPVIVRFSDFKTNEYRTLVGGEAYEPEEANPMIGWRGASRYYDPKFKPAFLLECEAYRKVREEMGLTNVVMMIPFCRTPEEGKKVLATMAEAGLKRGKDGLRVYVMVEIPSNIILADKFAEIFDGFSIGSNDLTQLTLGVDRDSALVARLYDEQNEAVKKLISQVIKAA